MGSVDIPPFLRDKMKQKVQESSGDIPPFLKKKESTPSVDVSVSATVGSNQPQPTSLGGGPAPSISPLPLQGSDSFSYINYPQTLSQPTINDLDSAERKTLNSKLPSFTTQERMDEAIKGIIETRKNPAVKLANAQSFLSDDLDSNPGLYKDLPFPEKFKDQIVSGSGDNLSSITIEKYYTDRSKQIDQQILDLQGQLYVKGATTGRGINENIPVKIPAQNFDEIKSSIDQLTKYKEDFNRYANILTSYQATKEVPKPADQSPDNMKEYYRNIGLRIQSVNDPIKASNKKSDIESGVDAVRHPELVDVENYRLESDGLSARQFALNADFKAGNISEADYVAQSNEVSAQSEKLLDLHPQAKKVAEYQAIGQILQRQRDVANTKKSNKGGGIKSLFENVVAYGFNEDEIRQAAQSMGKTEDEIKQIINNKDDIPGTSFLANVYNKFIVHSGTDLVAPIGSLITKGRLPTEAEFEAERYSKDQKFQLNPNQQFNQPETLIVDDPKSPDFLQRVANPKDGNHNWGYGSLNGVGDALGTLGQLWLTTELTGSLGDVGLGGKIGAEVVGVGRTATGLTEIRGFNAAQKALFGNVAGMMVTGYNENKLAAKNFISEEQGGENARNLYALTRSMETGLLFGMGFSPQTLITKALGKAENEAAAKSFAEIIPKGGIESLGKETWGNYLKKNLATRIATEGLKENLKATSTMSLDEAVGVATQAMYNPQSVDTKNLGHDLLSSGIHNFVTFAPISFFGAGVSALKNPHIDQQRIEQEAIYRAGLDPTGFSKYAQEQVEIGAMLQSDANNRIKLVNTMADIQKNGNIPAELSRSERVEYANNLLHEKKITDEIKNLSDPVLVKAKERQVSELQKRREEILTTSTGIEKDDNGRPVIKTKQNEENIATETQAAEGAATENKVSTDKYTQAKDAETVKEATDFINELVSEKLITGTTAEMAKRDPMAFLKMVADQAQNVTATGERNVTDNPEQAARDQFTDTVVDYAKELFPVASEFESFGTQAANEVKPILKRINDADYINESELNTAADKLYDLLDRNEKSNLTDEQKVSTSNLIEPLIQKIEGYEFRTKTESSTVTETTATQVPRKTPKREIKPALEQSAGSEATVTFPDGGTRKGKLSIKSGEYVLDIPGSDQIIIGEKAITDRDLKLPEESRVENPIAFDENGNVKSVTFEARNGNLVTIDNPEKALDLAIQLRAEAIGEVEQPLFDTVYKTFQKEVRTQRLVNEGKAKKETAAQTEPQAEKKAIPPKPEKEFKPRVRTETKKVESKKLSEDFDSFVGKEEFIASINRDLNEESFYGPPLSEKGKSAIEEANRRIKEIEDANFNFIPHEDAWKHTGNDVAIGNVGIHHSKHGKGLGTLGYILKGEEYLKKGQHLVSEPDGRTEQAKGVWKKLVDLGLATEYKPDYYRYGGERESGKPSDIQNRFEPEEAKYKNSKVVLEEAREHFKDTPALQKVMDVLEPILAENPQIKIDPTIKLDSRFDGMSYPDGRIAINFSNFYDKGDLYRTMLHEYVHAITRSEIRENKAFREELEDVLTGLRNHLNAPQSDAAIARGILDNTVSKDWYGIVSVDELLSEVFTNPKFSNFLKTVEYKGDNLLKRLFLKVAAVFSNKYKSLLEAKENVSADNIADYLMGITEKVVKNHTVGFAGKEGLASVNRGNEKVNQWIRDKVKEGVSDESIRKVLMDKLGLEETAAQRMIEDVAPVSGIRHADTETTRKEQGLGEYDKKVITDKELEEGADKAISEGYNIEKLLTKLEKGDPPSSLETVILKKYKSVLDEKVANEPSDKNLSELKRFVEASDRARSDIGRALRAGKGQILRDESLGDYFVHEMESAQVDTLTVEQKAQVEKEFKEKQEAEKNWKEKNTALKEAQQAMKAQSEINRATPKVKKTTKTHEQFVKERQDIVAKMREDLLKAAKGSGGLTASVPGAAQLRAVAPHVAKLVRSLAEEGIVNLKDMVADVHDKLKDILPGITEKDVHNIIAGDYNRPAKEKSDLTKRVVDLKEEAKLINKLEALENGQIPTAPAKKIQRNRNITELRKQIAEVQKRLKREDAELVNKDAKKLESFKNRALKEAAEIQAEIDAGNFAPPEKKTPLLEDAELRKNFPDLYKEAKEAKDKLIKVKLDREVRLLQQQYANRTKRQKAGDLALELLNVPRTIMASADFSAPLRQGVIQTISHPAVAMKAFAEMLKQALSQKRFDRWFHELREELDFKVMEESGLYVADPHDPRLSAKEEQFMNNLAVKIPFFGKIIKGSERAYVSYLNKMRVDLFRQGEEVLLSRGKTIENAKKDYEALASWVNNSTGRGGLNKLEAAAPILNATFFSPRLIASRLNLLNPVYYGKLSPEIRKMALKDMGKFVGFGLSVLAMAKLAGADVETNPISSDFGKIKVGNTRYDIWGGFQQYVRVISQIARGKTKSTNTGKEYKLDGKGLFGKTRADVALAFGRGKLAPVPSMVWDFAAGRTPTGEEVTLSEEAKSHLLPLLYSDSEKAIRDQGVAGFFTTTLPATFGIGVQTYSKDKKK